MKASLVIKAISAEATSEGALLKRLLRSAGAASGECRAYIELNQNQQFGVWDVSHPQPSKLSPRRDVKRFRLNGDHVIHWCFVLESGRRYLVREPRRFGTAVEYFCHVSPDGEVVRE